MDEEVITGIFPDSTVVTDYAYADDNPLRYGQFKHYNPYEEYQPDLDDGEYMGHISTTGISTNEGDYGYDDTYDYEYNEQFNLGAGGQYYSGNDADQEGEEDENVEINEQAIALFDFVPENDNEVGLTEGQIILISYRHGQGWLVAEDPNTGENGLVPEEYVEILDQQEVAKPFKPELFNSGYGSGGHENEWVDTDQSEPEDERDEERDEESHTANERDEDESHQPDTDQTSADNSNKPSSGDQASLNPHDVSTTYIQQGVHNMSIT